jgi:SAM-dependent MidA family methyltransferase
MVAQGGRVTFARFMELALTHPTEGYYSRTRGLLGPRGHFSTAPRLSQVFSQAVGRLLEELIGASLEASAAADVPAPPGPSPGLVLLELGAGEADLPAALLRDWEARRPELRECLTYAIVEVGERLRARQQRTLAKARDRGWKVRWARTVGEALAGAGPAVVVGNEFVDALPVHLVDVRGEQPEEVYVEVWTEVHPGVAAANAAAGAAGAELREARSALSVEAEAELLELFGTSEAAALRPLTRDGIIELRPAAGGLLRQVAASGRSVCLLTVDYGEWFAAPTLDLEGTRSGALVPAGRYGRTLRGYFRHQMVTDPYLRVGRQDLTADVDFRALDLHGRRAGFETVLFTAVADLLLADRGDERLRALLREAGHPSRTALDADHQAMVLEALLDNQGMGAAFKVMLQVKE